VIIGRYLRSEAALASDPILLLCGSRYTYLTKHRPVEGNAVRAKLARVFIFSRNATISTPTRRANRSSQRDNPDGSYRRMIKMLAAKTAEAKRDEQRDDG
jgi:hypothetical protein